MSDSYLVRAALFLAVAVTTVLAGDIVHLGDRLINQCKFMVDGYSYNLCPLLRHNMGVWTFEDVRQTPPSITTHQYRIAFNDPLPKNVSLSDDEQCPPGTWICLTKANHLSNKHDEPPRIIETIPVAGELVKEHCGRFIRQGEYYPGLNITAYRRGFNLTREGEQKRISVLHVRLHGGYYVDRRQMMSLGFVCSENEKPEIHHYEGGWEGFHSLYIGSKHACPTNAPDKPPAEDETQELINLPSKEYMSRKVFMILFSSCCAILLVAYCIHSPRMTLRQRVQKFVKAHPSLLHSRVAESVLVRWAYEDMALEEGEEDVMVNASDPVFDNDEEQIPLKPSPRMGSVTSYGTAK